MLDFKRFFNELDQVAPLSLSQLSIANGGYDNSGIIVKNANKVEKVLFSLDLSDLCVERAIKLGCDTIVTHHPAIYYPIKNLSIDGENKVLLNAINNRLSVISMHLNLDVANDGIDQCLALALGAKDIKILDMLDNTYGYGREFEIDMEFSEFVKQVGDTLETSKIIAYGSGKCKKIASFCGGGGSHAIKAIRLKSTDADTIVTSDLAHHEIKEMIESGIKVLLIPHYASEEYGFRKFEQTVKEKVKDLVQTYYFQDKRFM